MILVSPVDQQVGAPPNWALLLRRLGAGAESSEFVSRGYRSG